MHLVKSNDDTVLADKAPWMAVDFMDLIGLVVV